MQPLQLQCPVAHCALRSPPGRCAGSSTAVPFSHASHSIPNFEMSLPRQASQLAPSGCGALPAGQGLHQLESM
jgi:hypothetical protein